MGCGHSSLVHEDGTVLADPRYEIEGPLFSQLVPNAYRKMVEFLLSGIVVKITTLLVGNAEMMHVVLGRTLNSRRNFCLLICFFARRPTIVTARYGGAGATRRPERLRLRQRAAPRVLPQAPPFAANILQLLSFVW